MVFSCPDTQLCVCVCVWSLRCICSSMGATWGCLGFCVFVIFQWKQSKEMQDCMGTSLVLFSHFRVLVRGKVAPCLKLICSSCLATLRNDYRHCAHSLLLRQKRAWTCCPNPPYQPSQSTSVGWPTPGLTNPNPTSPLLLWFSQVEFFFSNSISWFPAVWVRSDCGSHRWVTVAVSHVSQYWVNIHCSHVIKFPDPPPSVN